MAEIANPQKTTEILRKYGIHLQKRLGQNFLVDERVVHKIVDAAEISPQDTVLEIGPGIGTLTQFLCERAREVLAVEIDKALIPVLQDTLSSYQNVSILCADFLKLDLRQLLEAKAWEAVKVVANLPYYITTPILMNLLESDIPLISATVMIQKEVADRLQASPGTKEYGALTLAVQYYADLYLAANVPANCFLPRPAVGSAVLHLTKRSIPPVKVYDRRFFFSVIRAAFSQRRKTLCNCLSHDDKVALSKECVEEAVSEAGLPSTIRGEALSMVQFAAVSNFLWEKKCFRDMCADIVS